MPDIRPCPFCGYPAPKIVRILGEDGFRDRFAVRCDYESGGCGAEGGWRHEWEEAVDAWNMRKRVFRR